MRIVLITAGTGGRYCGACLRDIEMARALTRAGHDASILPLYLSVTGEDGASNDEAPVSMGGVATWLASKGGIAGRAGLALERPLAALWLLKLAAWFGGMTEASSLGSLTQTMVDGERPAIAALLARVAERAVRERPDALLLSNALLLGLAPHLRERVDAPILCTLQSEVEFVADLGAPWTDLVWSGLAQRAHLVDGFVAVSDHHRREMSARLGVEADEIFVVPHGVRVDDFHGDDAPGGRAGIAYLARIDERHGAGRILEAFAQLDGAASGLTIAGSMTGADEPYVRSLRARIKELGLEGLVHIEPNISLAEKRELLRGATLLCVPAEREAAGRYVFEALAASCPVVLPRVGALIEWVEATGGGLLYEPSEEGAMAEAMARLLADEALRTRLADTGRRAVEARYQGSHMAHDLLDAFGRLGASSGPDEVDVVAPTGGGGAGSAKTI